MIRTRRKLLRELVAGATIATMPACATESPATPHAGGSRSAKHKAGAQQADGYQPGNVQPLGLSPASGFRSGLPWRSGVASWKPEEFAEWRGRPLDVLTTFSSFNTWDEIEKLGRDGTMLGALLDRPEQIVVSFAMFPRKDGPVPRDEPILWKDAANGSYDEHWERAMRYLRQRRDRDDYIFRPGWEWNSAKSYPWGIVDVEWAEAYQATFRRLVGIIKTTFPNAKIDWCSLKKGQSKKRIDMFYPGDEVVDYIGQDRYDRFPAAPTPEAFARTQDETDRDGGPVGIRAWLRYAQSKGKPMSIPEWGVWSENGRKGGGAGDNPVFIEQMFAFFSANAKSIGYECYFNNMGGDAQHRIGPGDVPNPLASEAYARLYRPA